MTRWTTFALSLLVVGCSGTQTTQPNSGSSVRVVENAAQFLPEPGKYEFKTGWSEESEIYDTRSQEDGGLCTFVDPGEIDLCLRKANGGIESYVPQKLPPEIWLKEGVRAGEEWTDSEGVRVSVEQFGVIYATSNERLEGCLYLRVIFPEEDGNDEEVTHETVCPGRGAVASTDEITGGKRLLSYQSAATAH